MTPEERWDKLLERLETSLNFWMEQRNQGNPYAPYPFTELYHLREYMTELKRR